MTTFPSRTAFGQTVYTPAEIAVVLRISEKSVRREIQRGRLSAVRIGNQYRISPGNLIAWLGRTTFHELFTPLEGLDEAEATATAIRVIAQVRAERPVLKRPTQAAPGPEEVRRRREARREAEGQKKD